MGWMKHVIIAQAMLLAISMGLMSCQQDMKARGLANVTKVGDNTNNPPPVDLPVQMDEVDKAAREAEKALRDATELLDGLFDADGNLTIGFSSGQASTQFLPDVTGALKKVFDRILAAISKVKQNIDNVRAKIEAEKAKLDPFNPAHAALLVQLDALLAKLDMVEARLDDLLLKLADRVDFLLGKLDQLKAKLDPLNPLHFIPLILLEQVRSTVLDFKTKLVQIINS
ncbi:MAG: hypothetical protein KDD43_06985 [Bdellovibrionales bacterium]|nr:hypothetical protein [Bdellovibrionales bacterium]